MTTEPSAPAMLEELIRRAQAAGASDVHLQMRGRRAEVAFRLDGLLTPVQELAEDVAERVVGRVKYLARLKTYQESMPQDGRIAREELGTGHDIRVATYPTVTGEKLVLRRLTIAALPLDQLGIDTVIIAELDAFLRRQSGLLLLTGPAGSGKTSTIYACLRALSQQGGRHVITIEDPAEQVVEGLMQTEINEARGLTFAKAARHLLRQDPQVLVIGEMRDEETAAIAVRAALTGHLVISTLHAGSCRGVIERLLNLCPDPFAAMTSLDLVLNQRLMRRTCEACSGKGCDTCLRTGYRGRLPVVEWLRLNDTLRKQIRGEKLDGLQPVSPLADAARALVARGVTDEREFTRLFPAS